MRDISVEEGFSLKHVVRPARIENHIPWLLGMCWEEEKANCCINKD